MEILHCSLRWRHNDHDSVSNHQHHHCLLNRLFRCRSKKTSKLRVTGLCAGNSPGSVNSSHKWPVTRKMFPFDDVIMLTKFSSLALHQILLHMIYPSAASYGNFHVKIRGFHNLSLNPDWVLSYVFLLSIYQELTHWGRGQMAAIFQTTSSNAFSWMKIYEFRSRFHWSLFLRVQLTTFQHWFR